MTARWAGSTWAGWPGATANAPAAAPDFSLSLGGLPRLLWSLRTSFRFAPPTENRLDDLRIWTLDGQWNSSRLAMLLPDQKAAIDAGQPVDLSKLASQLPDRVVLRIGCDDLFPYRIEYWRREGKAKDSSSADRGKLLVVVELYEVQLGARSSIPASSSTTRAICSRSIALRRTSTATGWTKSSCPAPASHGPRAGRSSICSGWRAPSVRSGIFYAHGCWWIRPSGGSRPRLAEPCARENGSQRRWCVLQ